MRMYESFGLDKARNVSDLLEWSWRFVSDVGNHLRRLARIINGQITFGDGTDLDNIKGKWITFTASAVAGAENTIAHDLGVVPPGFLIAKPPTTGTVNLGATTWTTSNLYLTCSAASQTVVIFVLAPPESN